MHLSREVAEREIRLPDGAQTQRQLRSLRPGNSCKGHQNDTSPFVHSRVACADTSAAVARRAQAGNGSISLGTRIELGAVCEALPLGCARWARSRKRRGSYRRSSRPRVIPPDERGLSATALKFRFGDDYKLTSRRSLSEACKRLKSAKLSHEVDVEARSRSNKGSEQPTRRNRSSGSKSSIENSLFRSNSCTCRVKHGQQAQPREEGLCGRAEEARTARLEAASPFLNCVLSSSLRRRNCRGADSCQ